jgi:putative endonuclease
MDRREVGAAAEELAAAHLEAHGLGIVLRNFRRRTGELDLVALDRRVLVIVEVRMRASAAFGGAGGSIDGLKQARIVRTARQLLQARRDLARLPVRFDVILVGSAARGPPRLEWIRAAFNA